MAQPLMRVTDSLANVEIPAAAGPQQKLVEGIYKDSVSRAANPANVSPVPQINSAKVMDANIPRIDLDDIEKAKTPEARKAEINKFGDALKTRGFIAIKSADIAPMLPAVNAIMKKYFAQDMEAKKKDIHNNNYQTGYAPFGTETAAGEKNPDYKETYFIPPNYKEWPELEGFKEVMEPYHNKLRDYSTRIVGYIFEYLELQKEMGAEDPVKSTESAHNLLRLAHYLPKKPGETGVPLWAGLHTDLNLVTLLPPPEVPGLRMVENGVEKAVTAEEGWLILNTGEPLENFTAGMFKAGPHLVRNPADLDKKYEYSDRHASIFFASWSGNFDISPHPKLVEIMTKGMTNEEKRNYLLKFAYCTTIQQLLARLIELNNIKHYSKEQVLEYVQCNLLKKPTEDLVKQFPDLFVGDRAAPVALVKRYPVLFPVEAEKLNIAVTN